MKREVKNYADWHGIDPDDTGEIFLTALEGGIDEGEDSLNLALSATELRERLSNDIKPGDSKKDILAKIDKIAAGKKGPKNQETKNAILQSVDFHQYMQGIRNVRQWVSDSL